MGINILTCRDRSEWRNSIDFSWIEKSHPVRSDRERRRLDVSVSRRTSRTSYPRMTRTKREISHVPLETTWRTGGRSTEKVATFCACIAAMCGMAAVTGRRLAARCSTLAEDINNGWCSRNRAASACTEDASPPPARPGPARWSGRCPDATCPARVAAPMFLVRFQCWRLYVCAFLLADLLEWDTLYIVWWNF